MFLIFSVLSVTFLLLIYCGVTCRRTMLVSYLIAYLISFNFKFFFLLALQPPLGVVFHSPLAGFSLLAYEVS